jgi:DNA-binding transcriptional ArsR family regulator
MAVDQENVSKILSVISHRLRREILLNLSEKNECSFTELMNALNLDPGKLSFHLRSLGVFLEQTPNGKYRLSKVGENVVRLIKDLEGWAGEAEVARKTSSLPIATFPFYSASASLGSRRQGKQW